MGLLVSAGVWISESADSVRPALTRVLRRRRRIPPDTSDVLLPSMVEPGVAPWASQPATVRMLPMPRAGRGNSHSEDLSYLGAERLPGWHSDTIRSRGPARGREQWATDPVEPLPVEETTCPVWEVGVSRFSRKRDAFPVVYQGEPGGFALHVPWLPDTHSPQLPIPARGRVADLLPNGWPLSDDMQTLAPWRSYSVSRVNVPLVGSGVASSLVAMSGDPDVPGWMAGCYATVAAPVFRVAAVSLLRGDGADGVPPIADFVTRLAVETASGAWVASAWAPVALGRSPLLSYAGSRVGYSTDDAALVSPLPAVWASAATSPLSRVLGRGVAAQADETWLTSLYAVPGPYWSAAGGVWIAGAEEGSVT